jgi:toxin ParE1/3/4
MRVYYHPAVEAELREIQRYYEDRCPGLGVQFLDEFERQVLALAATPERWMVVTAEIRRCLMRRFPYVIYFRRAAPNHSAQPRPGERFGVDPEPVARPGWLQRSAANKTLDRMTRSAVSRMFQPWVERHWRAPRHRSALRSGAFR